MWWVRSARYSRSGRRHFVCSPVVALPSSVSFVFSSINPDFSCHIDNVLEGLLHADVGVDDGKSNHAVYVIDKDQGVQLRFPPRSGKRRSCRALFIRKSYRTMVGYNRLKMGPTMTGVKRWMK